MLTIITEIRSPLVMLVQGGETELPTIKVADKKVENRNPPATL